MISFHTADLSTITLQTRERGLTLTRKITSIYGIPFYCSTGTSSSQEGTWFPFFGISTHRFFVKRMNADEEVTLLLQPIYGHNIGYQLANTDLPARFASVGCMLLSSRLGGGLWDTAEGIKLEARLKEKYPAFYDKWPMMLLGDPELTLNERNLFSINTWLLEKAFISDPKDLTSFCPPTVDDLFKLKTRAESQPLDTFERDCCRIL
ncbi:MAG: hypothetical protein JSR17_03535 [Proteobacteria bacterium]|nr:hypothetical protein [Pseudomonadota bacterium]